MPWSYWLMCKRARDRLAEGHACASKRAHPSSLYEHLPCRRLSLERHFSLKSFADPSKGYRVLLLWFSFRLFQQSKFQSKLQCTVVRQAVIVRYEWMCDQQWLTADRPRKVQGQNLEATNWTGRGELEAMAADKRDVLLLFDVDYRWCYT